MPPINTRLDTNTSVSPAELQRPFEQGPELIDSAHLTPSLSSANQSSESLPARSAMPVSPQVTVSHWDRDQQYSAPVRSMDSDDSPTTVRGGFQEGLDRGRSGLDPGARPSDEVPSLNEAAEIRKTRERNRSISKWLSEGDDDLSVPREKDVIESIDRKREETAEEAKVRFGGETENQTRSGMYYSGTAGEFADEDYKIILANRGWEAPPALPNIYRGDGQTRHQPETSQAAIERMERLERGHYAASRMATWGTRRLSLPSVADFDIEEVTSGNILKKLSLTRSNEKGNKTSVFKEFRDLIRRPSTSGLLKRSRSTNSRPTRDQPEVQSPRDSTSDFLAPPERTTSWGKKPTPSINTALVSIGHASASIGTTHSRSGSVSGTPITSPKSPRNSLSVIGSLRRQRSKSDLPKPSPQIVSPGSHPNLVGMLARTGGPPVPNLKGRPNGDAEDDDDDDDELYEDADMKKEANLIDQFPPNFSGFQQHVLTLNPLLVNNNQFLVERIGHQQIIRYKHLLVTRVKHLGMGANCPSGALCVALGGTANILEPKGEPKSIDPISAHLDDDDEEGGPAEGAINQESFPQDIPMPPTGYLPAEFECQLCFQKKKFQKPSDWTKHVHEDVQPFTCTWDKCRDPKIFKRKADWVRHENEGHRHLEWWTCDVEDCRHTCYRRDNFLQHLVREHKLPEPKIKTKAAMKKAGGMDPTWQKVEQCHIETSKRPQEEPCRFCGKQFPTWKKLTVHLAKHMEQITLPVLRLVATRAKELAADTIISPVQDPPPRNSLLFSNAAQFGPMPDMNNGGHQLGMPPNGHPMFQADSEVFMYPVMPAGPQQHPQAGQPYFSPQFDNIGSSLQQSPMSGGAMSNDFDNMYQTRGMGDAGHNMFEPDVSGYNMGGMQGGNGGGNMDHFQQLNALGLQNMGGNPMAHQQMVYNNNGMMDLNRGNNSPFSGQGSVSPFQRSPHQNNGNQNQAWDENQMSGFM